MSDRFRALSQRVDRLQTQGLQRRLQALNMTSATTAICETKRVHVFCSNDYLGLTHHPDVMAAWKGTGAGSARLISGNRPVHEALEAELSELYGRPATLFSSGYHANLGLLSTVLSSEDVVASDALNHASIIDGIRLSRAQKVILAHQDTQVPQGCRLTVVEGLYSMDGDRSRVGEYSESSWLMVDEAHAFGVLGPDGRGVAAGQGIDPDFVVGTLGKAIGAYGAFVVGPDSLRSLLISQGRSFLFTTGLPEPVAWAALAGLRAATNERRERLVDRVIRLRSGLSQLGIKALGLDHIVPIVLGEKTMTVAQALSARGFFVVGIRPPTVKLGEERIRITVSAQHSDAQIDGLLEALDQVLSL